MLFSILCPLRSMVAVQSHTTGLWFGWVCVSRYLGRLKVGAGKMDNVKASRLCFSWQVTSGKIKLCREKLCGRRMMSYASLSRIQGISFWKRYHLQDFHWCGSLASVASLFAASVHLMSKWWLVTTSAVNLLAG